MNFIEKTNYLQGVINDNKSLFKSILPTLVEIRVESNFYTEAEAMGEEPSELFFVVTEVPSDKSKCVIKLDSHLDYFVSRIITKEESKLEMYKDSIVVSKM